MRLIDTLTFKMQEFPDAPLRSSQDAYAILSHVWGTDEVTFDEYKTVLDHPSQSSAHRVTSKAGWSKISKCCAFAQSRGRRWVWIDTCCIDKKSSAELSEAINSMWDWYASSAECYVHMADVSSFLTGSITVLAAFSESAWFTRAWYVLEIGPRSRTLQELLAPKIILFVNESWETISGFSKWNIPPSVMALNESTGSQFVPQGETNAFGIQPGKILDAVAISTKIPKKAIATVGSHIFASVAQRMSWAASRRATRSEDTAYSLLGLFDISMPLLYGEKGEKAFLRLQKEIIAQSYDDSIFVWKTPATSSPPADGNAVLASSPHDFKESGRIICTTRIVRHEPYTLTNRGLRMVARFTRHQRRVRHEPFSLERDVLYSMLLTCNDNSDENNQRQCCLVLKRDPGTGQFGRVATRLHGHEWHDSSLVNIGIMDQTEQLFLKMDNRRIVPSITPAFRF